MSYVKCCVCSYLLFFRHINLICIKNVKWRLFVPICAICDKGRGYFPLNLPDLRNLELDSDRFVIFVICGGETIQTFKPFKQYKLETKLYIW